MRRFAVLFAIIAFLSAGFEFATDYGEVIEAAGFAAMPDGHDANDGHAPADHHVGCDPCHFGGVHLLGLAPASSAPALAAVTPKIARETPRFLGDIPEPLVRPPIA